MSPFSLRVVRTMAVEESENAIPMTRALFMSKSKKVILR